MSVHSQQAAQQAAHPEFPRHVVTAVLVSHDGERWLPEVLRGLLGQERPVQGVIAADTGSADSSATLLTEALGAERVLHLARRTGFGAAVAEAARTAPVLTPDDLPYLRRPAAWDPVRRTWDTSTYDLPELPHGEPVQWLWLLHDDSAPAPDALAELLRQADASPSTGIVGGKLRGWYDRRQLLEVGVSVAYSGRRWTGLDRREQDQGQHDRIRPVLAVSSAGMLIRRDVYDQLGGFDRRLPLTRDDVDLCWRAQAAGHGVLVAPDAVFQHAEAATRERRSIDCAGRLGGSPHRVDKAAASYTLLANARTAVLPWVLFRLLLGTVLRILAYLVGKQPGRALDEAGGLLATLLRPGRLIGARRGRARTASPNHAPKELRPLFPPPGATVRTAIEQVASNFGGRAEPVSASSGRHGSVESGPGGDDADSLEVEQFARVKRLAKRPGPVLFLLLAVVALLAGRALIGGGALSGGALLPAPADAGALWDRYLTTWQPVGTGGTESAPPFVGLLALFSSALLGNVGPAMTLLLVGSVPLAGISAYLSSGPLVMSRLLRAWGSVAYAFLPAVTGAVAGGRLGTALLAVLLPPLARVAVAAAGHTRNGVGPWRAAWACALLLTVGTAFTPVIWPLALLLAVVALVLPLRTGGGLRRAKALRFAVALGTPLLLLAPWSFATLLSPDAFLREVGLPYDTGQTSALQLVGLSPGGPGTPSGWLLLGVLLAALGALLRAERGLAIRTAWAGALVALLFAIWADTDHWAGPAVLVYGLALLSAAVLGADGARYRVAARSFGWRQPLAVAVAGAAAVGPLLAAAGWVLSGAEGPLRRSDPVQVPAFVAEESAARDQARTLVLDATGGSDGEITAVSYTLVRGSGARLGDADLAELLGEDARLSEAVGDLTAGTGADQTRALADYAVRYVLVRDGGPRDLHRVLDTTPGLQRLSQEDGSALWRVNRDVARAMVLPAEGEGPDAEPVPLPAEAVEVHTELPDGPAGRVLRLADHADEGFRATLNGEPLTPVTVGDWAQGFELPAGGGQLDVVYETSGLHTLWVWAQGFGLLVLVVLSLPDRRRELDDDLPDEAPAAAAPQGRRARRMAAVPAQGGQPAAGQAAEAAPEPVAPAVPHQAAEPPPAEPEWAPTAPPAAPYAADGAQPGGAGIPRQQPYDDWSDQSYGQQYGQGYGTGYPSGYDPNYPQGYDQSQAAPYDYPTDYGDGSEHR
ncbi:glycosyltransferase family 2 protein [Streptomyces sp. DSM 44915]|uniref:Glycosyltransferase family 2 protein n=1 Tax=Streptomyces chisholmiae TaxID=3075540 RepID=A0ABU2K0H1_9ACTN|nr:glycosyltransferase family 2 protein [Streptomyces sp. DSM 44915]MDT0270734.1 glycosyltransferase family 2 protein [Streptomyces sp. DSM 44915]